MGDGRMRPSLRGYLVSARVETTARVSCPISSTLSIFLHLRRLKGEWMGKTSVIWCRFDA